MVVSWLRNRITVFLILSVCIFTIWNLQNICIAPSPNVRTSSNQPNTLRSDVVPVVVDYSSDNDDDTTKNLEVLKQEQYQQQQVQRKEEVVEEEEEDINEIKQQLLLLQQQQNQYQQLQYHQNTRSFLKLAVLVEPYHKLTAIKNTVINALYNLPNDWQVVTYLPRDGKQFIYQLCNNITMTLTLLNNNTNNNNNIDPRINETEVLTNGCLLNRIRYEQLPDSYDYTDTDIYPGTHWRNKLFINSFWWNSFLPAQWVLMIQCDTIICQHGEPPLKYMYIGGPHIDYPDYNLLNSSSTNQNILQSKYYGPMNGGFSIRNVQWSIDCINSFQPTETFTWCEDSVFERCYHTMDRPTYQDAILFSSDNGWTGCISIATNDTSTSQEQQQQQQLEQRHCPYGLHKPWILEKLTPIERDEMIQSCPGAAALEGNNKKIIQMK